MEQPDPTPPDEEVLSAQIIERLLHYEELDDAELSLLEADPSARVELHRLQLAEAWLTEPFHNAEIEPVEESACPSAEDLFDFGQKIEPTGLNITQQVELAEHLESCPECEALVGKLAERPPSPLIVVDSPLAYPLPAPAPRPRSSRAIRLARGPRPTPRSGLRHVPFLVAASLLAVLMLSGWPSSVLGKSSVGFPSPAAMRGNPSQRLVSPTNLVLSRSKDLPGLNRLSELFFEIVPKSGDVWYEVTVYRGHHSALVSDAQRKRLHYQDLEGEEPTLKLAAPLQAGKYFWVAQSYDKLNLPTDLGHKNFNVRPDRELEATVLHLGATVAAVKALDDEDHFADARELTRYLDSKGKCSSYEAERYLAVTTAD